MENSIPKNPFCILHITKLYNNMYKQQSRNTKFKKTYQFLSLMQTTIVNLQALDALSSTLESITLASQMLGLQLETPKLYQITFLLRLYQMQVTSLVTFTKLALIQSPYKNTYGLFLYMFLFFRVSTQKLSNHSYLINISQIICREKQEHYHIISYLIIIQLVIIIIQVI